MLSAICYLLSAAVLAACHVPLTPPPTVTPTVTETLLPQGYTATAYSNAANMQGGTTTAQAQIDAARTAVALNITLTPSPTPVPLNTQPPIVRRAPPPTFMVGGTADVHQLITFFTADQTAINPGDTVTLHWQATGQTITLCTTLPTSQLNDCKPVPPTGTQQFATHPEDRNFVQYILFAQQGDQSESASVNVKINCPVAWFFTPAPPTCAQDTAITSDGAAEHFEHGWMIWVSGLDAIFVLFDDGQSPNWDRLNDPWQEGFAEPTADPEKPDHLYQPVRGFGMVWRGVGNYYAPKDRLGWAGEEEFGFQTAYQCDSAPKYNTCYLQGPEGVIVLEPERSGWHLWTGQ